MFEWNEHRSCVGRGKQCGENQALEPVERCGCPIDLHAQHRANPASNSAAATSWASSFCADFTGGLRLPDHIREGRRPFGEDAAKALTEKVVCSAASGAIFPARQP